MRNEDCESKCMCFNFGEKILEKPFVNMTKYNVSIFICKFNVSNCFGKDE